MEAGTRPALYLLLVLLEPLDEPVGGAVVVQFGIGLGQFRKNLLRELLAEFNTPLNSACLRSTTKAFSTSRKSAIRITCRNRMWKHCRKRLTRMLN